MWCNLYGIILCSQNVALNNKIYRIKYENIFQFFAKMFNSVCYFKVSCNWNFFVTSYENILWNNLIVFSVSVCSSDLILFGFNCLCIIKSFHIKTDFILFLLSVKVRRLINLFVFSLLCLSTYCWPSRKSVYIPFYLYI